MTWLHSSFNEIIKDNADYHSKKPFPHLVRDNIFPMSILNATIDGSWLWHVVVDDDEFGVMWWWWWWWLWLFCIDGDYDLDYYCDDPDGDVFDDRDVIIMMTVIL